MFRMLAAASLTLALTAPAYATETPQPAKPKKVAKICRSGSNTTGSRMQPPKVCKTAEQWAAIDAKGETDINGVSLKGGRN